MAMLNRDQAFKFMQAAPYAAPLRSYTDYGFERDPDVFVKEFAKTEKLFRDPIFLTEAFDKTELIWLRETTRPKSTAKTHRTLKDTAEEKLGVKVRILFQDPLVSLLFSNDHDEIPALIVIEGGEAAMLYKLKMPLSEWTVDASGSGLSAF